MILYFFKFATCSALLLMLYYWVLEKEKMLIFNRFYLLFSIIFSALAPLFVFELSPFLSTNSGLIKENVLPFVPIHISEIQNSSSTVSAINTTENLTWDTYWWILYTVITFVLLVRLFKNLYSFWINIRMNQVKKSNHLKLVLLSSKTTPYSFGNYVFVNQSEYEGGKIEPEILVHEQAHIQQRHSLDIVFVELLLVFVWWNPALWLYRKAIMLNHEFLADDWVIKTSENAVAYQHLLLQKIAQNKNIILACTAIRCFGSFCVIVNDIW
jgi:bla regulator protein blaR1